jgi:O-antigen/teichoic acid export membrane protein
VCWRTLSFAKLPGSIEVGLARRWLVSAASFAAAGGAMVMNRQVDLLFVGFISGAEPAGIYRVAIQGSMLLMFGLQAVGLTIGPYFAKNMISKSTERDRTLMQISVRTSVAFSIPAVLIISIFGKAAIILLFGINYEEAYCPLLILCLANVVMSLNGSIVPLLNMNGHEKKVMNLFGQSIIICCILCALLVDAFGPLGASIAALISTLILAFRFRYLSIKYMKIDPIRLLY